SGGLEIEGPAGEEAVIVSPSGVDGRWVVDAAGADVALFDDLLRTLGDELCLDPARVFSYGFSAGARMTTLLACIRGTQLRGVAPVAGTLAGEGCAGPVAAWVVHGTADEVNAVALGAAARDRYVQING